MILGEKITRELREWAWKLTKITSNKQILIPLAQKKNKGLPHFS